jgi:hypothetical protein
VILDHGRAQGEQPLVTVGCGVLAMPPEGPVYEGFSCGWLWGRHAIPGRWVTSGFALLMGRSGAGRGICAETAEGAPRKVPP